MEGEFEKMHITNFNRPAAFYNLDVIILIDCRMKLQQCTQ
jgi:hypothetical protein